MLINITALYEDHQIPYFTTGKNVSAGWINIRCVFCDDQSNHLGFSPSGSFLCWKCGGHPVSKTIARLLNVSEHEAIQIIKQYGGRSHAPKVEPVVRIGLRKFQFPHGTDRMTKRHDQYLISRKFDPEKLEEEWNLLGTGPKAPLDNLDYKHRIIIPIRWDNKVVSFISRDITNRHQLRYITCPPAREIIDHKRTLYGQTDKWGDTGVCVEGVTDVWRLGTNTFATFGTKYTIAQVAAIRKLFKRVFVLYDNEEEAQNQASKLVAELQFRHVEAIKVNLNKGDPGDMPQKEADYLMKTLMRQSL